MKKRIKVMLALLTMSTLVASTVATVVSCSSSDSNANKGETNNNPTINNDKSLNGIVNQELTINTTNINQGASIQWMYKYQNTDWTNFPSNSIKQDSSNPNVWTLTPTQAGNVQIKVIVNGVESKIVNITISPNEVLQPSISINNANQAINTTTNKNFTITTTNANIPSNANFVWQQSPIDNDNWIDLTPQPNPSVDKQTWTFNFKQTTNVKLRVVIKDSNNSQIITQSTNSITVNISQQPKPIINDSQLVGTFGQPISINTTNIKQGDNVEWMYKQQQNTNWINFPTQPTQDSNNPNLWTLTPTQVGSAQIKVIVNGAESDPVNITINSSNDNPMNMIEGVDYFKINNQNITMPTTKNKQVLDKYGNIPLPQVDDSAISSDDIANMFVYLTMNRFTANISVGQRKIESNLFIEGNIKFLTKYWKYFPYFSTANNGWFFKDELDPQTQKHYITGCPGSGARFINLWNVVDSNNWFNLENFYQQLMYLLQENMTDMDKLLVAYQYIINWVSYGQESEGGNGISFVNDHFGVCADITNILGLILNSLNIPAFPIKTAHDETPSHQILWVYIDPTGGNNKQWYGCDPTGGTGGLASKKQTLSSVNIYNLYKSSSNLLFSIGEKANGTNSNSLHNYGNKFFNLNWTDNKIFLEHSNIGTYNFANDNSFLSTLSKDDTKFSKFFYINGYWYAIKIPEPTGPGDTTQKLIRIKADNSSSPEEITNVPSEYVDKIIANKGGNLTLQYKDNVIFLANEQGKSTIYGPKKLYIFKIKNNDIDWTNPHIIDLKTDISIASIDLEIANKKCLIYDNNSAEIFEVSLTDQDINYLEYKNYNSSDVVYANTYYQFMIGNYLIDNKQKYQQKMNLVNSLNSIVTSSDPIPTKLNKLQTEYNNFKKTVNQIKGLISGFPTDSIIGIPQEAFDISGLSFNNQFYDSLQSLIDPINNTNLNLRYSIYYSSTDTQDKSQFKLVGTNLTELKLTQAMLDAKQISSVYGYYYFDAYQYNDDNPNAKFSSNIIRVVNQDIALDAAGKLYLNNNNVYVNIDNNQLLTSNINLNYEKSSLYPDGQLYYINKDTKQISVVNNYQLNKVDNSNHGIYFGKVNIPYEGKTYSVYTRAIFILTENDYQNFDNQINEWMELAKLIK